MNQNQDEKLFTRPDMSPANWSSWSEKGELETGNANIYCKNPIGTEISCNDKVLRCCFEAKNHKKLEEVLLENNLIYGN